MVLGRHEERKGVAHAINAVRAHNAKGDDAWRLVVLGDGPRRRALEALAAGDQVIVFVGAPSDEEKRRWLRRANALIAPSIGGESFGMILLEAMASETSVVASDIEGYREAADEFATCSRRATTQSRHPAVEPRAEGRDAGVVVLRVKAHAQRVVDGG